MSKNFHKIFGIIFFALLLIVFGANIFVPDKAFSEEENRMLEMRPSFTLPSYFQGRYESKMERYADDQFILRNWFIKVKSSADASFGKTESNGVFLGSKNYLLEDINVPEDEKIAQNLNALRVFYEEYPHLNAAFILAPNAANILSDNLPLFATVADQNEPMDKFFAEISSYGFSAVDVRASFNEHKEDTQLYYRTDHHWTVDGAYLAYLELCKIKGWEPFTDYTPLVVKTDFRGTLASKSGFTNGLNDPITIYLPAEGSDYKNSVIFYGDTKEKTTAFYRLDNLALKDAYTVFGGSNHPMYTIKTPVEDDSRLLLIKDSYANSMIPFLSQHYREIVVIDPRYFFDDISAVISTYRITDALFIYNANTFFADNSLEMMINADVEDSDDAGSDDSGSDEENSGDAGADDASANAEDSDEG